MSSIHDGLISVLKSTLNDGENLANILTDLLLISKEGAYRRLRGEIQLTLDESINLSKKLGISIDNLIEESSGDKHSFHITPFTCHTQMDAYYQTLTEIMSFFNYIKTDPQAHTYIVGKTLSPTLQFKHKEFTKLSFFKWLNLLHIDTKYMAFSDVVIPLKFEQLFEAYISATTQVATTYILNDFIFNAINKDLFYFYTIGLLSKEDVEILKQQELLIIDELENIAANGKFNNGAPVSIYITNSYFDASYNYIKGNGFEACGIGAYGLNFLSCTDKQIIKNHKLWIDSLIKYSTYITQSGEVQRLLFFNKQRERINSIILKSS